jgi:hypothetical protein
MHFILAAGLFAILVAALVGNRIALVAMAALVMMVATLILLVVGLGDGPSSPPRHEWLWAIPAGWWFVILLGRWASNG